MYHCIFMIRTANKHDIPTIRELTFRIWPKTYGHILQQQQIDYMLDMMYSEAALEKQMAEQQHQFILFLEENTPLGFASFGALGNGEWKLHKIYILPDQQGKGIGKQLVQHIVNTIKPLQAKALLLNVNKYNNAKQFYEKTGFEVIREEDIDIGNGYFMNDYVMQLSL